MEVLEGVKGVSESFRETYLLLFEGGEKLKYRLVVQSYLNSGYVMQEMALLNTCPS